jgi:hypothetical protein
MLPCRRTRCHCSPRTGNDDTRRGWLWPSGCASMMWYLLARAIVMTVPACRDAGVVHCTLLRAPCCVAAQHAEHGHTRTKSHLGANSAKQVTHQLDSCRHKRQHTHKCIATGGRACNRPYSSSWSVAWCARLRLSTLHMPAAVCIRALLAGSTLSRFSGTYSKVASRRLFSTGRCRSALGRCNAAASPAVPPRQVTAGRRLRSAAA